MRNPKEKKSKKKAIPGGGAAARAFQFAMEHSQVKPEAETAAAPPVSAPKKKPAGRK